MWFFGKKKDKAAPEKKPVDIHGTQKKLDDQSRMLELNVKKYEKKCDDVVTQAKAKLNAGDRKGATLLMKKKKMYEKEISKLEGMQMFIEQQKLTMESNQNNANVFDTMKNAAD